MASEQSQKPAKHKKAAKSKKIKPKAKKASSKPKPSIEGNVDDKPKAAKKAPAKKSKTKSKHLDDLPFEGPQL